MCRLRGIRLVYVRWIPEDASGRHERPEAEHSIAPSKANLGLFQSDFATISRLSSSLSSTSCNMMHQNKVALFGPDFVLCLGILRQGNFQLPGGVFLGAAYDALGAATIATSPMPAAILIFVTMVVSPFTRGHKIAPIT